MLRARTRELFPAPRRTRRVRRPIRAGDLFAGAGGWTTGASWVPDVRVVGANNHNEVAMATHEHNHPWVVHVREDISVMDPWRLPAHQLGIASPACTGHSDARGQERPEHDAARMTAYGVLRVWEFHQPRQILVENVEEFLLWSPAEVTRKKGWKKTLTDTVLVHHGGGTPRPHRAGKLFLAWLGMLQAQGYSLTINLLDAARFGVPQERVRVIISGDLRRKPAPILYPDGLRVVTAGEVIDWNEGRWRPISEKVAATQARWERGRAQYGECFVMPFYGSGSGLTGRSLDRPLGTVPAADVWGVVKGERMRMLTYRELLRAMSFPESYVVMGARRRRDENGVPRVVRIAPWLSRADVTLQLGNAVPPLLARNVVEQTLESI